MFRKPENRAFLLLSAAVFLWGINWPVMKIGLDYIGPMWFALARNALGCASLFAVLVVLGRLHLPTRRELPVLISVGVLQVAVNTALIHIALQYTEAGRSAFLAYTTPLWATPLAAAFLGERLSIRKIVGLALGIAGIAALFDPASFDFTDRRALVGSAMLIAAAMLSASVIVHVRARGGSVTVLELVPWQMLLGTALLVPATFLIDGPPDLTWSPALIAVLAYNGPVTSGFCIWAFVVVMRDLPATLTSVGSLGTPAIGLLASAAYLGEALPPAKILGICLITVGVLTVTLAKLRRS